LEEEVGGDGIVVGIVMEEGGTKSFGNEEDRNIPPPEVSGEGEREGSVGEEGAEE
jgi:hypothetical protein